MRSYQPRFQDMRIRRRPHTQRVLYSAGEAGCAISPKWFRHIPYRNDVMLFIPYIFDDFYQISRGYFPSSMRPSPFVNRTEHKSCSDKMQFLFNWTLGSIFKIAFYPPVGINFCTPPNFDFKDGEATFKGFDNHYLQNPIKKNYPGEEMEIDFSPVLFWCLFKPPK